MTDYDWGNAPRGLKVALADDEEYFHCAHCDRYAEDDPRAHPTCLIVKKGSGHPVLEALGRSNAK